MPDTSRIRWTGSTWNPMSGCSKLSDGCKNCYAYTIAEKFRGTPAYPHGFDTVFKPAKLRDVDRWKDGRRVFVNSMSDLFHDDFLDVELDQVFDTMARVDRHTYQVLTKRPTRMRDYIRGWLERRDLDAVPAHIWLGVTIESDRFTWRANRLREIPVAVRFISAEPLLSAVPSLNLDGIAWLIIGGESGHGFRPMDMQWARELVALARSADTAVFFKQDSGHRTELRPYLVEEDGSHTVIEEYPDDPGRGALGDRLGGSRQEPARRHVPQGPLAQAALI